MSDTPSSPSDHPSDTEEDAPKILEEPSTNANSLDQWVHFIAEKEMPIFSQTAAQLAELVADKTSSTADLSQVILKDPALTSKVLRMANSSYYNPRVQKLKTVTRAIVVLGFNVIRNISLSSSLLEPLIQGYHQEAIGKHVRRSIHAAVIAKSLALKSRDPHAEEIFIATLLMDLGHFAFWCFSKNQAEKLYQAQQDKPHIEAHRLETKILGFKLSQLTHSLCKCWSLCGGLLENSLQPDNPNPTVRKIRLSHEYAMLVAQNPEHAELPLMQKRMATLLNVSTDSIEQLIDDCTQQASDVTQAFGLSAIEATTLHTAPPIKQYLEPDLDLQNNIFKEIAEMHKKDADTNLLFEMIAEGIHRGIGMDRTIFSTLTPASTLKPRIIHAHDTDDADPKDVPLKNQGRNYFHHALELKMPFYYQANPPLEIEALKTPLIKALFGNAPCFFMPIIVSNKPIGLFTADRKASGRPLSHADFSNFKKFVMQANLYLSKLKRGNKRKN